MRDEGRADALIIVHCTAPAEAGATALAMAEALAGPAGRRAAERGGAWLDGRRVGDPGERVGVGAMLTLRLPPAGGYAEVALTASHIATRTSGWWPCTKSGAGT